MPAFTTAAILGTLALGAEAGAGWGLGAAALGGAAIGLASDKLLKPILKPKAPAAVTPPPAPPTTQNTPEIAKAVDAYDKMAKDKRDRSSTILTSPSGVLGDPPLDRPRASSLLGG